MWRVWYFDAEALPLEGGARAGVWGPCTSWAMTIREARKHKRDLERCHPDTRYMLSDYFAPEETIRPRGLKTGDLIRLKEDAPPCRIVKVWPLGTYDVESLDGSRAWRVTGLYGATLSKVDP